MDRSYIAKMRTLVAVVNPNGGAPLSKQCQRRELFDVIRSSKPFFAGRLALIHIKDSTTVYAEGDRVLLGTEDWVVILRMWDTRSHETRYFLLRAGDPEKSIQMYESTLLSSDEFHARTSREFYRRAHIQKHLNDPELADLIFHD